MNEARHYKITLTGTTSLLMHYDNVQHADRMDAWKNDPANKKKSKAGDDRTPAFRWLGYLYHDGDRVALPADNLMRCQMEGASMVYVPGGRSGKTFKAQSQSGVFLPQPYWPLLVNGGEVPVSRIAVLDAEEDFAVHERVVKGLGFSLSVLRATVGQSKHIRVRPEFRQWSCSGNVIVTDEQITTKTLQDFWTYAGQFKGLCEWRPSARTPGHHGMFSVVVEEEG